MVDVEASVKGFTQDRFVKNVLEPYKKEKKKLKDKALFNVNVEEVNINVNTKL